MTSEQSLKCPHIANSTRVGGKARLIASNHSNEELYERYMMAVLVGVY